MANAPQKWQSGCAPKLWVLKRFYDWPTSKPFRLQNQIRPDAHDYVVCISNQPVHQSTDFTTSIWCMWATVHSNGPHEVFSILGNSDNCESVTTDTHTQAHAIAHLRAQMWVPRNWFPKFDTPTSSARRSKVTKSFLFRWFFCLAQENLRETMLMRVKSRRSWGKSGCKARNWMREWWLQTF